MDGRRFDILTRTIEEATTRRTLLRTLMGSMFGVIALTGKLPLAIAKQSDKVGVCHQTGSTTNPVAFIEVSASAVPAHAAHGDLIDPDFGNDPANCGGCGIGCDDGDPCTIDSCVDGQCQHSPVECEIQQFCTTATCVDGQCVTAPIPCDDSNGTPCNIHTPCDRILICLDGQCLDPCFLEHPDIVDFCNPVSQICTAGGCAPA